MTSQSAERDPEDAGLLTPASVGGAAEAATGDAAFLTAMLEAEAALTRALVRLGLAPESAAVAVDAAAGQLERYDVRGLALRARAGGNPVIPLVADLTAVTAEIDPDAAEYVHRGATSQDIVDTALMLMARRTLGVVLEDLARTALALGGLAKKHRETPMAGRTLTQHAVPTTFGLKAAGWRAMVLDAHERLAAVCLPAQLGGAAGTLAAFTELHRDGREALPAPPCDSLEGGWARSSSRPCTVQVIDVFSAEVGLQAPTTPWHTLRTPVADLGNALGFAAGALGRLAEDVLVLARTEIGEVAEGAGGGSSAMPHKSNPVRATLISATARQVPSLTATLLGSLAAADERPAGAWHAEWQTLRTALRLVGGAARDAAELAENLRVFPARMRANLDLTGGAVVSERLAVVFAARLGRQEAKDLLARASRQAAENHTTLAEALAADPLPEDLRKQLPELLDPAQYLGAAPALVDRALSRPSPARQEAREELP